MAMQLLKTAAGMRAFGQEARSRGLKISFVPTMGALHAGHLSLVELAKNHADRTVASIFVNPTQFGPNEDYTHYPRMEREDMEKLEQAGVDAVFLPGTAEIYSEDYQTFVTLPKLAGGLDGAFRPGHFDGVASVLAKLFNIVGPDVAVFGEKDYQQLQIVRRMVADLHFPIEIVGAPVIREEDGLAMSSRNRYLSEADRKVAPAMYAALHTAAKRIGSGTPVAEALRAAKQALLSAGFGPIDYFELVDAATLAPLNAPQGAMRLLAAAHVGTTRLIDNIAVIVGRP